MLATPCPLMDFGMSVSTSMCQKLVAKREFHLRSVRIEYKIRMIVWQGAG